MHFRWNPNILLSPHIFSFVDDVMVPAGGMKSKEIASNAFTKSLSMEALFPKTWEVTQFVNVCQHMLIVWDVLGMIRI
jgi:hypothetical protein